MGKEGGEEAAELLAGKDTKVLTHQPPCKTEEVTCTQLSVAGVAIG